MIEDFNEKIKCNVIKVKKDEISIKLGELIHNIKKIDRLPFIIDLNKEYKLFSINYKDIEDCVLFILKEKIDDSFAIEICLNYNYFTYKEILRKLLPLDIEVPSSFEIVGKILHLNLKEEQLKFKNIIGNVLLKKVRNIETVVTKIGTIDSQFRFFRMEVLAGKDNLETIHLENGIKFFIDYGKVYWNSRLQTERELLLKFFKGNQVICDLFCGVGPVVLPAIKKGCLIQCNDLNAAAIECLKKSLKINNLNVSKIELYNEDAESFIKRLEENQTFCDHYVLNLPELSLNYLKFFKNLKKDALIHCYFFCNIHNDPVSYLFEKIGLSIDNKFLREIKSVSPSKNTWKLTISFEELENRFKKKL